MTDQTPRGVLVSGASGGLGSALAVRFAHEGFAVVGLGRDASRLEATADRCKGSSGNFQPVVAEATDEPAVEAAVALLPRLTHCVVNAGMTGKGSFVATSADDLRAMLEVNTVGSFILMRAAAARMAAEGGGHITVVTSLLAARGRAGRMSYAASKHGLLGIARTLQDEFQDDLVGVTIVEPGSMATPMSTSKKPQMDPVEVAEVIVASLLASSSTVRVTELLLRPHAVERSA